jgi:acyl transferase domain-containing protein/acyl carrier protein
MTDLRQWMVDRLAQLCSVPPGEVDVDRPLREYGLRSADVVSLSGELEELLDRPVEPTLLWEHPTIRRLAEHLATGSPGPSPTPRHAPGTTGGIALIGIGCRLPGGIGSARQLWEFLCSGGDAIGTVPEERWACYRSALLDRTTRHGGFLDDVIGFDAEFFGIAPAEAAEMDPQQRMLLEVAWEALEHAGVPPYSLAGSATGVFVGACGDDHARRRLEDLPGITAWSGTGAALSIVANRLSYLLDLRGPSLTVDTACSSSLVALHLARQSLLAGDCDVALVGGVNLLLSPGVTVNFDHAGVLAPDGRCKPFDEAADGYVRSEGCAVVVAKRLEDAVRDGDRVLAALVASGVNQDGRSNGLMAPNPAAQKDLLGAVYRRARLDPAAVSYVEAHGTGTSLGDAIEAEALGTVFHRESGPLLVGSVKSNLGHLEAAAGIAGVIKCVLSIHHNRIPPTIHHARPSPRIPWSRLGIRVVTETTGWPHAPALAGVSSFGFGGTNGHAVLTAAD